MASPREAFTLFRHGTTLLLAAILALPAMAFPLGQDSARAMGLGPAALGSIVCFSAFDGEKDDLWCTDGRPAGTYRITHLPRTAYAIQPAAAGGAIHFFVYAEGKPTVWRTDGTPGGTRAVLPLGAVSVRGVLEHQGALFFATTPLATWPDGPTRLWKTTDDGAEVVVLESAMRTLRAFTRRGTFTLTLPDATYTLRVLPGIYATAPFLPPGTYTVEAAGPGTHVSARHPGTVTIAGTEVVRGVDFILERFASITGIVRDAVTRQPLYDATVTVTTPDVSRVETDAQGRFTIASLLPGEYLVTAAKKGWGESSIRLKLDHLGAVAEAELSVRAECATSPSRTTIRFPAAGGSIRIGLGATCERCLFRTAAFIEITRSCAAVDDVIITVGKNHGRTRTGLIVLPGTTIHVEQD